MLVGDRLSRPGLGIDELQRALGGAGDEHPAGRALHRDRVGLPDRRQPGRDPRLILAQVEATSSLRSVDHPQPAAAGQVPRAPGRGTVAADLHTDAEPVPVTTVPHRIRVPSAR